MEQEHHSSVIYSCVLKMVKLITMMLVTWRQNKEKEKLLCLLTQTLSVRLCFKWHCTKHAKKATTETEDILSPLVYYRFINFDLFLIMWQKPIAKKLTAPLSVSLLNVRAPSQRCHPLGLTT